MPVPPADVVDTVGAGDAGGKLRLYRGLRTASGRRDLARLQLPSGGRAVPGTASQVFVAA